MDNVRDVLFVLKNNWRKNTTCNLYVTCLYKTEKNLIKLVKGLTFPIVAQLDCLDSVNTVLGCKRFC